MGRIGERAGRAPGHNRPSNCHCSKRLVRQALFRTTPFGPIIDDRVAIKELGGEPALGRSLRSGADLQAATREGFPQPVVQEVMHGAGITLSELASSLDL